METFDTGTIDRQNIPASLKHNMPYAPGDSGSYRKTVDGIFFINEQGMALAFGGPPSVQKKTRSRSYDVLTAYDPRAAQKEEHEERKKYNF
jgi:hypothetical protein